MMLKGIKRKKIEKLFEVYDANGNGHLDMNDAVVLTDRFSVEFGWPKGGLAESKFKAAFFKIWTRMFREADVNHDRMVSKQEFLNYFERATEDDAHFYIHIKPILDELFPVLDSDNDGLLTKTDYKAFYRACNNTDDDAEFAFSSMDINKDGVISHFEFYNMMYHFYMSGNPKHNSRNFFGRIK